MTTADVFERRVRRFDEVLGFLERLAETPWARFRDDPEKYGSAERFSKVAVGVLNDLGAHLVARSGGEPVAAYRDVPRRLREAVAPGVGGGLNESLVGAARQGTSRSATSRSEATALAAAR